MTKEEYDNAMEAIKKIPSSRFVEKSVMRSTLLHMYLVGNLNNKHLTKNYNEKH